MNKSRKEIVFNYNHSLKRKQSSKRYYDNNPEKMKEFRRKRTLEHKSYILKTTYGISLEEYNRILEIQNYVCAICLKPERHRHKMGKIFDLSVDHNHTTGNLRKLLCRDCNLLIGLAKENPLLLRNAAQYLEEHN